MAAKGNRSLVFILILVVAVVVVAVIMLRRQHEASGGAPPASPVSESRSAHQSPPTRVTAVETANGTLKRSATADTTPSQAAAVPVPMSSDEPVQNAISSYHVDDFRSADKSFKDYRFEGLKETADGITLDDKDPNSTGPRSGVLESPTLKLEFPANLVGPIWRSRVPEGTAVKMEIAISPDGKDWSSWFPCEADDQAEPRPNYPDGRPNPNYGATIGTHVGTGLKLYPYVRYRVTMSSENDSSPLLQEVRLYHVDATAGQGFVAGTQPPPGYTQETEPPAAITPPAGYTNPTPGPSPTPPAP